LAPRYRTIVNITLAPERACGMMPVLFLPASRWGGERSRQVSPQASPLSSARTQLWPIGLRARRSPPPERGCTAPTGRPDPAAGPRSEAECLSACRHDRRMRLPRRADGRHSPAISCGRLSAAPTASRRSHRRCPRTRERQKERANWLPAWSVPLAFGAAFTGSMHQASGPFWRGVLFRPAVTVPIWLPMMGTRIKHWFDLTRPSYATAARGGALTAERRSSRSVRQKAAPPLARKASSGTVITR
jgi:hypothetical protein